MSFARALRVAASGAVAVLVVGTVSTAAEAKPPTKPGGVTNLTASATAHAGGGYDVTSSWDPAANATKYKVLLTKSTTTGTVTLSSATVTTTSWNVTVATTPGSGTLTVQPVALKKPGAKTPVGVVFPDVTPPTGAFHSTVDGNGLATLAITTPVSDDSPGPVTASVNWDSEHSTSTESWDLTSSITHDYGKTAGRYVPTVTLTDASPNHNQVTIEVNAVVVDDTEAPTGVFTVSPGPAWSKLTPVTVSQTALTDNWSPADKIARTVDWGDGTSSDWTTGTTISHVYQVTASQVVTPTVTLTDEAGISSAALDTSAVTVNVDSAAPVVKLTLPRSKHSVRAFRTLRGKATDAGTGVAKVNLKAVEKRGRAWYGYNPTTKKWVRAATKTRAFSRARAFTLIPTATHTWSAALRGLTKGTLVWKVTATDLVGNRSAALSHQSALTKR